MKKLNFAAFAAITLLTFYGCKKSSSSSAKTSTSTWKLAGKSYSAKTTTFISAGGIFSELVATDAVGNTANVEFLNTNPVAGSYVVTSVPTDSTQCIIGAVTQNALYSSSGKTGDKVTLSISGSKETITFSNITLVNTFDPSDTTTISGTLIQQ